MTKYGQFTYNEPIVTQKKNDNHNFNSSSSTGKSVVSSSSTGARACARTREEHALQDLQAVDAQMKYDQYQDCCRYFEMNFRRQVPFIVQQQLADLIKNDMSADVIRVAMDETQMAPRPSWAYCAAILRRFERDGIKTLEDWVASKEYHHHQNLRNPQFGAKQEDFGPAFFRREIAEVKAKVEEAEDIWFKYSMMND